MFVRAANPIWWFFDLTGIILNDEYFAFFLTNTLPYLPQPVYQDPNGIDAWANPLEFLPSGNLPDNLYFDPTLVYRIEIRHGNTQTDPLIWEINNFVPGNSDGNGQNDLFGFENQITNPQFVDIDFASPLTFTQAIAGTYTVDVAPGWVLVLTGAGTTILTRNELPGTDQIQGNPPYSLTINNSGWTTAILQQRFNRNGAIFEGGAVGMTITAQATGSPQNISFIYMPSSPGTPVSIFTGQVAVGSYEVYKGAANLPDSGRTNSNVGDAAFVDMQIVLQGTGIISLTNVQVVGQSVPLDDNFVIPDDVPIFQEETVERQIDHEFHFFKESLLTQPKASLLTGWNFGLNPWQFTSVTPANVAVNQYTADQTIIIQQAYVASAAGNNVSVGQDSLANNHGLKVTAVTANNEFGILQYIDPATIRPYWNNVLSSMVKAFITTTHSTTCNIKMRLFYRAGLPNVVSQTDPIASWTAGGDPVFAAGYTAISPINDPSYTLTADPLTFAFNGFELPVSTNANMTLGIFLYTVNNMDQTATADFITINDVSLVHNDFAIQTQPDTYDVSLRKCQYYYEKSYLDGILPGTVTVAGQRSFIIPLQVDTPAAAGTISVYLRTLNLLYKQTKRGLPLVTFYSPTGTANSIQVQCYSSLAVPFAGSPSNQSVSQWDANVSTDSLILTPNNTGLTAIYTGSFANTLAHEAIMDFQYTADSRLGV